MLWTECLCLLRIHEVITPSVVLFGGRTFGGIIKFQLDRQGGALMMRLVSFQEGTGEFALSFCHVRR